MNLFSLFLTLSLLKFGIEYFLEKLNRSSYEDTKEQALVCEKMQIDKESFEKTLSYTKAKSSFGTVSTIINLLILLGFIAFGGFGILEAEAASFAANNQGLLYLSDSLIEGLAFFFLFFIASSFISIPFSYYSTFSLEERFGFNKQSHGTFFMDIIKGTLVSIVLGGILMSLLLKAMTLGEFWWVWAWIFMSAFSMLTSWIYPVVLAPLFNKFSPVEDEELKEGIFALAKKVNFGTSGIYIMDASTRSSHGNAYFTGIFGEKRIVLFDTLVKDLSPKQIVAVLAHELGHFKLKHVRWGLIRSLALTGALFYLLSLCLNMESFYHSFGFSKVSNHGALVVFSLWFSLISFVISPLMSFISRQNEFAADAFAKETIGNSEDLGEALITLSKSNHSMPISHPLYSLCYYSHPPILERLKAMGIK